MAGAQRVSGVEFPWYDTLAMVRQKGVFGRYRADDMNRTGTILIVPILLILMVLMR
jgi:hypothetical protein